LIEIVIVIVILGLLTTFAMPRILAQMERANVAEALVLLGTIRRAFENCYALTENGNQCASGAQMGVAAPAGAKFSYSSLNVFGVVMLYQARRTVSGVGNYICMFILPASGQVVYNTTPANSVYRPPLNRAGVTWGGILYQAACGAFAGNPL
jgi:hypothetical protein